MATKKKLKTAEISLIGCSSASLTAADTATEPIAKYALDSFSVERQMKFENGGNKYYVPFHAVDHIIVTETETEVADKPTPYGCCPEGTVGGSVVGC